ncbi:uncharacterized protein LOC128512509 [Clarias gariepinus]|uniref:uncharacterized protein LOC128512509 n=1 Tax=Clarias gariepinus TaxID=13013 RepID=UPI00234C4359|nr:uncharacterized protein LOC128512509 [Clarias gariepinus]
MSELLFTPQLLFGLISLSLLQIISADLISVDPGENITLLCNITQYSEISWYQLNSASVRQIISARQRGLYKDFYVDYNVDESHFDVTESSSSVSLVIIGVRETDLGFYYCGGRNDTTHTQFGKNIKLNFTTGSQNQKADGSDTLQSDPHTYCLISLSLLQIISADLTSVDPEENITLLCNITQVSEISWYQMNSAGVRQIISARQRGLYKDFYVDYNVDESHFDVTESSSSVSLVIIGVRETDLGFYFCGGRNDTTHTQFGKHIRLDFTTDALNHKDSDAHTQSGVITIIVILLCVCMLFISISIVCPTKDKEADIQPSDVTCVIYTRVSRQHRKKISAQGPQWVKQI